MKKFIKTHIIPILPTSLSLILYTIYMIFQSAMLHVSFPIIYIKIRSSALYKQSSTQNILKNYDVIIIQPSFFNSSGDKYLSGGAERYLVDLAQELKKIGHTPLILQYASSFWHNQIEGINVFGLPCLMSPSLFNKIVNCHLFPKPKLVIYSPFTIAAFGHRKDVKSIGISHGVFWDHTYFGSFYQRYIKKSCLSINKLISVDTNTINWLRGALPNIASRIDMQYLPNYVDSKEFCPAQKAATQSQRLVILYPRRLYAPRGYFLVAEIIPSILKKYSNMALEFHFAGQVEAEARKSLNILLNKYPDSVKHYEVEANKMHQVYKQADISLIPTVASEGTSLSCLEAMSTQNAVIATNVGGLTDLIINEYNGLLIEPSAESLKKAIILLIDNPDLRAKLAANAAAVAACFNKAKWQEKWREELVSCFKK